MPDAKRRTASPRRCRPYIGALVVVLSTLGSGTLLAGPASVNVKGKVAGWEKLLPQVYVDAAKVDSHRYTWREPSPTVKQDFRKLSADVARDVCIVAFGASGQAHEPLSVKVTGGRMSPSTVVLAPGSRLSFKNSDPFVHVLYEVGNAQWAPNPLNSSSTREWAASAPGIHQIRDQLFPSVVMYITVEPNAVEFAFPDRDGNFAMTIPPGDYTFRPYFEGKPTGKEQGTVHVGERGLEMREPILVGGGEAK